MMVNPKKFEAVILKRNVMKKCYCLLIDVETVNSDKNVKLPGNTRYNTLSQGIYLHVNLLKEIVAGWKSHAIEKV